MLFKSFTGLKVKEFDNNEIKRLPCKRKDIKERKAGAIGRPFKLDVKNRFLMLCCMIVKISDFTICFV